MKKLFCLLRENKVSAFFALLLVSIPIVFSSSISAYVYLNEKEIQLFSVTDWAIVYTIAIVTMGLAITPTTFVAIIGGYFITWQSLFFMIPAYLFASLLCFFVSKKIDQGKLKASIERNFPIQHYIFHAQNRPLSLVIYSKLSPILPFALSNFLLAALEIPISKFIIGCFIGMLPRTLLAVWTGKEMKHLLQSNGNSVSMSLVLLLFIVSIIGLWHIFKSKKRSL